MPVNNSFGRWVESFLTLPPEREFLVDAAIGSSMLFEILNFPLVLLCLLLCRKGSEISTFSG